MKAKSVTAVKKSLGSEKQVVKGVASDLNVKQSTHSKTRVINVLLNFPTKILRWMLISKTVSALV